MFSRIGRSLLGSSRSAYGKKLISAGTGFGGVRSVTRNDLASSQNACIARVDAAGLGFVRSYLTWMRDGTKISGTSFLSEFNSVFANPRHLRLFCPKREVNYENYYPKDKNEFPKVNNQKSSEAKGTEVQNFRADISFQEFKTDLLEPGLVDRIDVSNKSVAKVYLKDSSPSANQTNNDAVQGPVGGSSSIRIVTQYKYYFTIGSVDSFEEKLEEAQEALGIDPHNYVPPFSTWGGECRLGVGGPGGKGARGIFYIGKAHVTKMDENSKNKIYFKDVAGCDEAKQEIMEFVHFLKNPKKYEELGAKIPKGALLIGPLGTGKTLLAKAAEGASDVPFLSISGSDFMEMFVGVGPARVTSLFQEARDCAPSIIFIDKIDAIGRARGRGGFSGGHDERESTLNQLLVEMDGFATTSGIVVLAGTNRPDILDKALLWPGRFDRQITIDKPNIKGRDQIFRIQLNKLKLDQDASFNSQRLAALTPGFAGADITNVFNEATLIAARSESMVIMMQHFEAAVVIEGLEKKNKVISKLER
ncbi:hypothetical protein ACH5RR_004872 [Cinchona calisaya]|uniref:AAA+ ATPase domain-containing protein n=1 Tax=Cinchona calisaya TaxID=153742 RepID=A0ABD3AYZ0_9GENT